MLLKGCRKNLVVLKGVKSEYIEEVYLLLRSSLPEGTGRGDIVKAANLIIHEYETGQKRKRTPFSLPSFFMGMLLACAVMAAGFLIFLASGGG